MSSIIVQNCKKVGRAAESSAYKPLLCLWVCNEILIFEFSILNFFKRFLPLQSIVFPGMNFLLVIVITMNVPNRYNFFIRQLKLFKMHPNLVPIQFTVFSHKSWWFNCVFCAGCSFVNMSSFGMTHSTSMQFSVIAIFICSLKIPIYNMHIFNACSSEKTAN